MPWGGRGSRDGIRGFRQAYCLRRTSAFRWLGHLSRCPRRLNRFRHLRYWMKCLECFEPMGLATGQGAVEAEGAWQRAPKSKASP
jgi:hypothetical protein